MTWLDIALYFFAFWGVLYFLAVLVLIGGWLSERVAELDDRKFKRDHIFVHELTDKGVTTHHYPRCGCGWYR